MVGKNLKEEDMNDLKFTKDICDQNFVVENNNYKDFHLFWQK